MNVNQFIGENLRKLANMSINQLKKLLKKIIARRNPNDAYTIQTIRVLIRKKKKEYPIIAAKIALKHFNQLKAANKKLINCPQQIGR